MKVLWVTAQVLPLVSEDLSIEKTGFGGWVMNMLEQLKVIPDLELGVAMVSSKTDSLINVEREKIKCYIVPEVGNKNLTEDNRDLIIKQFNPDIIHIEGNEFGIHNCFSKITSIPVLLSLQGILSGYEPYQYGELPIVDYLFSPNSKHSLTAWILYFRKHFLFDKRIFTEIETISNVKYLSGRTFWDHAHSYWVNPKAKYFVCNRILRPVFYKEMWECNNNEQYSIFVGNGYSPLKGLHFVIEAVNLLKKEFPTVKVYVAGKCPIEKKKKFSIHKYGYSNLIKKKIEQYHLEENIIFLGSLLGDEMVNKMKKCNVYCLPSLIENSPNTLGEAMMLGMPCVSAYTGGASDMAIDEKECLFYRANDPKLLAWQLRRIFIDDNLAKKIGAAARKHAMITHDPIKNRDMLLEAYKYILLDSKV